MDKEDDHDNLNSLARYLNIGWSMVAPLILGIVLGIYLDGLFHTKPFFVLAGIFLGFVVSIYNLWKLTKE